MGLFGGRDTDSGKRTLSFTRGSQTILGFVQQAKHRRQLLVIGSGVGVAIALVSGVAALKYMEADAAGRVVDGYSSLTRCMMGEPLPNDEVASVRFRQMQLTSLSQAELKRTGDKLGPWPDRCAKFAHGLHASLNESSIGQTKGKNLLDASKTLAEALDKKDGYWLNVSEAVDKAFDEGRRAAVILQPRPDVPPPPERAKPVTIDDLAKDGVLSDKPVSLAWVHAAPYPQSVVRFVIDDGKLDEPKLCTIALDSARCDALPAPVVAARSGGVRLLASVEEGALPLLFAQGGAGGIFRSTGEKIGSAMALGGYSAADGFAAVLAAQGANLEVVLARDNKVERRAVAIGRLQINDVKRDARILWGQALILAADGKELVLAAASVGPGRIGEVVSLGPLHKAQLSERANTSDARIDGCRAGASIVARARTGKDDFISFFLNGRWTAPLRTASAGGTMTCHGDRAVITRVDGGSGEASLDAKITQQHCTPSECRSKSQSLRELLAGELGLAPATPMHAATLDGKLLLAWHASQRGGIRLRVGDIETLPSTPDTIVYDDLIQAGRVVDSSTLLDMKVLTAERFAVLLIGTANGLRALRVGPDGKATPVKL